METLTDNWESTMSLLDVTNDKYIDESLVNIILEDIKSSQCIRALYDYSIYK